ncbi:MAG: ArnT family glycosyltransferase, partial [Alphaproteobacteria bacterium]
TNLPPLDRDEARFTQASKQMMESGDYIDIRYQDVARHKKPAGIYWLQVLSAKAHGGPDEAPINAYRLPSLVAAVAAVLLTAVIGAHLFGAMVGVGAGVVMSALFGLGLEAHIAKTDAALLFTVLLTQWGIARLYINPSENDRLSAYLFWGGLGLGVLIKGPITPMVAGLTLVGILIWERRLALIDPLFKLAPILLFLLIALPWYIAITIVSGGSFFAEAVGQDMLGKVASGQESHGAPPGYYAGIFALAFFPFAGLALSALPAAAKARATPAIRFLIVWALPGWLLFELMPTKLPHYVLPFFPALAIATSWLVMEVGIKRNWFTRAAVAFTGFIGGVLAIGLIGAPIYAMQLPGGDMVDYPWIGGLLILSGLGLFLHTNWHLFALPPLQLIARLWAASLLILGAGFGLMAPAMSPLWIAPRLADAAALHAPCPTYQIAVAGFHEPSFVFLTDTQTLLTGPANVATILADNECAIAIVDASERAAFEDALTVPAKEVATVHGLNYSRGDERSLSLFVRAGE